MRWSAVFRLATLASFGAAAIVACSDSAPPAAAPTDAEAGWAVARQAGCAACHGADSRGGVGPGWVGLYGSEVELADGSTVIADQSYLFESIRDPSAQQAAGLPAIMPTNSLSDDEIDAIVTYIESLADG